MSTVRFHNKYQAAWHHKVKITFSSLIPINSSFSSLVPTPLKHATYNKDKEKIGFSEEMTYLFEITAAATLPVRTAVTLIPVEHSHGLCIILTSQQLLHVVFQHCETQLQDCLYSIIEETVHHIDCTFNRQHTDKKGKEPGERDRGEKSHVRHVVCQLRQMNPDELLKHCLIYQGTCRERITKPPPKS